MKPIATALQTVRKARNPAHGFFAVPSSARSGDSEVTKPRSTFTVTVAKAQYAEAILANNSDYCLRRRLQLFHCQEGFCYLELQPTRKSWRELFNFCTKASYSTGTPKQYFNVAQLVGVQGQIAKCVKHRFRCTRAI